MMDAAQRVGRSGWVHRRPAGMAAGAAAVLVLLAAAAAPGQTVLRVRAGAAPGGNGSSWPAAFADLQSALTAAGPIAGGGGSVEIWVATGTYLPTLRTDAADPKSVTFQLASRVAILGGFSGTETLRGERSPDTNPTILSGDLNGDDTADDSHRWENATHVVTGIGVDGSAVLDGVTVTSGFSVPGVSYRDASGAGLRLINSSPSIIGCTIRQNWIRYYALGAGVYIAGTPGVATFQNCVFDQNRTNSQGAGAAMWLDSGTVLATGCTVTNNYGGDVAGGFYNGGSMTVANCTFSGNSGGYGGIYSFGPLVVTGSTFGGHTGSYGAGGVTIAGGTAHLTDCTFTGNRSEEGGAIQGPGVFTRCTFTSNNGAPYGAGAVTAGSAGSTFVGCTFTQNRAESAGAVTGTGSYVNCVFRQNSSTSQGAGAVQGSGSFTNCVFDGNSGLGPHSALILSGGAVTNCTVVNNLGGGVAGATSLWNSVLWNNSRNGLSDEAAQVIGAPDVRRCYVQGLTGALGGVGNLGGAAVPSPRLTADLRPAPGSICIDAGDNSLVPPDTFDVDGNGNTTERVPLDQCGATRFRDDTGVPDIGLGGAGQTGVVDIGAYEFQGTSCRADWDRDGAIAPADVALFVQVWLASLQAGTLAGDFDRDGVVQTVDVNAFVNAWFAALSGACPS